MWREEVMKKNQIMIFAVAAVLVLAVAAFTLTNNEGTTDPNTTGGENLEGNEDPKPRRRQ
jgi:hypothetical protein